jgi:SAM-dependent methyltransferase
MVLMALAVAESSLESVRELAALGETDVATIDAIRLLVASSGHERVEILNDLAVLRYLAKDFVGTRALLRAAIAIDPRHGLSHENLASLSSLGVQARRTGSHDASTPTDASTLQPWVLEGLKAADSIMGLRGKDVLEIGGCLPPEAARRFGVRSWTACDLRAKPVDAPDYHTLACDAASLPVDAESFDAAYSVCAFEHFRPLPAILAELHRVLRRGARLYTHFAPIWSSHNGHHLWIIRRGRTILTFNDGVVPRWAHLLLDMRELEHFLGITWGRRMARHIAGHIRNSRSLNRLFEGDFRRILDESPFTVEECSEWGGVTRPSALMDERLRERCPAGGDFSVHGLKVVLRKG